MPKEILTEFQKKVLKKIGESELSRFFIWSGGTALSFQYLCHRISADLDFLSQDLLPDEYLLSQVRKVAKNLKIKKIEEQKKFNRHEFWLKRNKETLRIEFVFYPFPYIKQPKKVKEFNIKIDSIEDILTNKTHTVYERAEPKDVFDFYCILFLKKTNFLKVFDWVEKKFGVKIDPVLFTSELFRGIDNLDKIRPLILKKELFKPAEMRKYFQKEVEDYLKRKIR